MNGDDAVPDMLASFPRPVNALVIGAARGIGHALARQLLDDAGVAAVFATARRGRHDAALAALRDEHPQRLHPLALDVTDEASIEQAMTDVAQAVQQLDLVINCAGILHDERGLKPERRLADVRPEAMALSFAVNATGPLLVARHLAALLPRQQRAVLATLSARVGSIGDNRLGGWYGYRASKAAQNMITRNLSIELRRRCRGIICVALHPGTVDTDLSRPFQAGVPDGRLFPPARAAAQLLAVIDGLQAGDNGGFFAWDGAPIPW